MTKKGKRSMSYGVVEEDIFARMVPPDIRAEQVRRKKLGSSFTYRDVKKRLKGETYGLGTYYLTALLPVLWLGLKLGFTPDELKAYLKDLRPLPGFLSYVVTENGVLVINNTASIDSDSLNNISELTAIGKKKKILVYVPGQDQWQREEVVDAFRKSAVIHFDYIISADKTTLHACNKIAKSDDMTCIILPVTRKNSASTLQKIVKKGDIVLFHGTGAKPLLTAWQNSL